MNVVHLSPHFPAHYYRFSAQVTALGANALGIGDEPYDRLAPELRAALTEYYRVDDLHDYDALLRACGYYTHKYGKLGRLDSHNEYWLQTEAHLRDDFNITGVRSAEIDYIRRKSKMKTRFRQAGVPVARGRVIRHLEDARQLIAETGYPIIAKPDAGVGALDTYKIHSDDELAAFFETKPDLDYIAEEFITGTIYSFDGLAGPEGELVFKTAHTYSQGIMETVNENRHIYYYSLRQIPPALENAGLACVRAFDIRERFFHIEFFLTPDNTYVALEVNMRPPGGFTTDMFNYANDIDIYRAWADLLVSGTTALSHQRQYHCCYASRINTKPYRHSHDEILSKYGSFMLQVESVPGVFSSALGDIGYIFRTPEREQVLQIAAFIQAMKE